MGKKVIVIGATGLVGTQLLNSLQQDTNVSEVICLVRRPVNYSFEKVSVHVVNFMDLEKYQSLFDEVTDVICCVGTTMNIAKTKEQFQIVDHYIPKVVGRLAKASGVQSYSLVSSLGADKDSRSFYLRVKGNIESDLQKFGFDRLLIYRPSLLLGKRVPARSGEVVMTLFFKWFFWAIPKKYHATDSCVLADLMSKDISTVDSGVHIFEAVMIK